VACHPLTPPEVLARLAEDSYYLTRRDVALHPSTPPEVLARLAEDPDRRVRTVVAARHDATPPRVLAHLQHDHEEPVRLSVTDNGYQGYRPDFFSA
jgi:hypothetical protein